MNTFFSSTWQLYRDAYSGHPRGIWSLALMSLINRMGMMLLPFFAVYLNTVLGFSLREAGFCMTSFGLGSLTGSFLGGKLSKWIGAEKVIFGSLFFGGFLLMALEYVHELGFLLGLIFLASTVGESYRPAVGVAVGGHAARKDTGRSMALIRLAMNLGMGFSFAIGGYIAAEIGYEWLFRIDGSTCVVAGLVFLLLSRPGRKVEEKQEPEEAGGSLLPPGKNRAYLWFLLSSLLLGLGLVQWFHSLPVFLKTDWGFDERYIGMLMGVNVALLALAEMPVVDWMEKAGKVKLAVLLGIALIGLSFLPFLLPPAAVWGLVAVLALTAGEVFFLPFNNAIPLNMAHPSLHGTYLSWYWMTWSVVGILGPLAGLSLAEKYGFSVLWISMLGLLGLSFLAKLMIPASAWEDMK